MRPAAETCLEAREAGSSHETDDERFRFAVHFRAKAEASAGDAAFLDPMFTLGASNSASRSFATPHTATRVPFRRSS